jgi:hypothetical protein
MEIKKSYLGGLYLKRGLSIAVISLFFLFFIICIIMPDAFADSDFDGISNTEEQYYGLDANDNDSDDDGVRDGSEKQWKTDFDGDGLINAKDPDSDNDGLSDGTEMGITEPQPGSSLIKGTDTTKTFPGSTRKTFIPDIDPDTKTDMLNNDTDGDGLLDGWDDANRNGILNDNETKGEDLNYDGDWSSSELNPLDMDTEDDGVIDGFKVQGEICEGCLDSDGDGIINGLESDSDNDGLRDCIELGITKNMLTDDTNQSQHNFVEDINPNEKYNTDPTDPDTDNDGIVDGKEDRNLDGAIAGDLNNNYFKEGTETWTETNPIDIDTDGDGAPDGDNGDLAVGLYGEDKNNNGNLDPGETDPLNEDTDGDGLLDGWETNDGIYVGKTKTGTDPLNIDSDGDDLEDGIEEGIGSNPSKTDTDNDQVPDGWEFKYSYDPKDASDNKSDSDEDGFTTLEEYLGVDGKAGGNDSTDPRNAESHPPKKSDNKETSTIGSEAMLIWILLIILIVIIVGMSGAVVKTRTKPPSQPDQTTRAQPPTVQPTSSQQPVRVIPPNDKLAMLENQYNAGKIDYGLYNELKAKYENQIINPHSSLQKVPTEPEPQQTLIHPQTPSPPISQPPPAPQPPAQAQQQEAQTQTVPCPICTKPIIAYSPSCPFCNTEMDW